MSINLDADLDNADWPKQSWDLPARNTEQLLSYLNVTGTSVDKFMMLPAAQAIPWAQESLTAGVLDDAAAELRPSRVIFEFDHPTIFVQRPDLDRETAYQIKFFYDHGYWAGYRLSGDAAVDLNSAEKIAVAVVTDPLNPTSEETRDRLISEGLLF